MAKGKTSIKRKVIRAGGWQIAKRVAKSIPLGGTAVAVVLVFRLILFPGTGLVSWLLTKVGAQCDTTQVTCSRLSLLTSDRITPPQPISMSSE